MKCPQCRLVEMLVKEIKEDKIIYVCKKCGTEVEGEIPKE